MVSQGSATFSLTDALFCMCLPDSQILNLAQVFSLSYAMYEIERSGTSQTCNETTRGTDGKLPTAGLSTGEEEPTS